jgi:hypothetical protein
MTAGSKGFPIRWAPAPAQAPETSGHQYSVTLRWDIMDEDLPVHREKPPTGQVI